MWKHVNAVLLVGFDPPPRLSRDTLYQKHEQKEHLLGPCQVSFSIALNPIYLIIYFEKVSLNQTHPTEPNASPW